MQVSTNNWDNLRQDNQFVSANLLLGLSTRHEVEITHSTFKSLNKKKQDLKCI